MRLVEESTGRLLGTVDAGAAHSTAHDGAVYLHQGETYLVRSLDLDEHVATVVAEDPGYSTSARDVTAIAITAEREQVAEVAVLERPGEQHLDALGPRQRLERRALRPEADDHGARVEPAQRPQEHVDALLRDQLPEVDDRRPVVRQESLEAPGVPLVRQALLGVAGIRRIERGLREEGREGVDPRLRAPELDVDPRRHLDDAVGVLSLIHI